MVVVPGGWAATFGVKGIYGTRIALMFGLGKML